jgi:hypothetical protein
MPTKAATKQPSGKSGDLSIRQNISMKIQLAIFISSDHGGEQVKLD